MKKCFLLLLCMTGAVLAAQKPFPEPASVKGKVNVTDFLNVRLGPGLRHAVTGRLNADQEVEILRIAENWLEIKAPENLKIYISEARVDAEGKLTGELNMRSRMDSTAPSYGVLGAGSIVKRLPERRNGWVRIVPPANLKVYVAAICVNFDRSKFDDNGLPLAAVKAEEKKVEAAAPEKVEAVKPAPAETPAPAEKAENTVPAEVEKAKADVKKETPQTAAETVSGVVVNWKFAKTPDTALAFLDAPNGKNQAFVIGKDPDIQKKLIELADSGKTVSVSGSYVAGKVPPVFEVSAISEK